MRDAMFRRWSRAALRRRLGALVLLGSLVIGALPIVGGLLVAREASAQGKVTRIVVGFPPGQATDQVARLLADRLTTAMGQPFIIDNRPGQGGSTALAQVARSPADGSVLTLSALAGYTVNPFLYTNVTYDSTRDFAPISRVADLPTVLVVNPSLPVDSLKALIDYAKANPDKLSHCSSGSGTLSHLMMEDLKRRADMRILHVPYKGSPPAMVDLVAGNVQVGLDTLGATLTFIRSGKLKILAVGSKTRLAEFPDVPTIAESGFPGFEAVAWTALTAPAGTPRDLRDRLNGEVDRALRDPAFLEKLHTIGAIARPSTVDELAALIASEQVRWKAVVAQTGAKAD